MGPEGIGGPLTFAPSPAKTIVSLTGRQPGFECTEPGGLWSGPRGHWRAPGFCPFACQNVTVPARPSTCQKFPFACQNPAWLTRLLRGQRLVKQRTQCPSPVSEKATSPFRQAHAHERCVCLQQFGQGKPAPALPHMRSRTEDLYWPASARPPRPPHLAHGIDPSPNRTADLRFAQHLSLLTRVLHGG